jgi:hypothetical protein
LHGNALAAGGPSGVVTCLYGGPYEYDPRTEQPDPFYIQVSPERAVLERTAPSTVITKFVLLNDRAYVAYGAADVLEPDQNGKVAPTIVPLTGAGSQINGETRRYTFYGCMHAIRYWSVSGPDSENPFNRQNVPGYTPVAPLPTRYPGPRK